MQFEKGLLLHLAHRGLKTLEYSQFTKLKPGLHIVVMFVSTVAIEQLNYNITNRYKHEVVDKFS